MRLSDLFGDPRLNPTATKKKRVDPLYKPRKLFCIDLIYPQTQQQNTKYGEGEGGGNQVKQVVVKVRDT